jgi:hypothetical protein
MSARPCGPPNEMIRTESNTLNHCPSSRFLFLLVGLLQVTCVSAAAARTWQRPASRTTARRVLRKTGATGLGVRAAPSPRHAAATYACRTGAGCSSAPAVMCLTRSQSSQVMLRHFCACLLGDSAQHELTTPRRGGQSTVSSDQIALSLHAQCYASALTKLGHASTGVCL